MMSVEEIVNEQGSIIVGCFFPHEVGEVLIVNDYSSNKILDHPMMVKREATRKEYIEQMHRSGRFYLPGEFEYYYEMTTD